MYTFFYNKKHTSSTRKVVCVCIDQQSNHQCGGGIYMPLKQQRSYEETHLNSSKFKLVRFTLNYIVNNHIWTTSQLNVAFWNWLFTLHRTQVKCRFITSYVKSSTYRMSVLLTNSLTNIKECIINISKSGINYFVECQKFLGFFFTKNKCVLLVVFFLFCFDFFIALHYISMLHANIFAITHLEPYYLMRKEQMLNICTGGKMRWLKQLSFSLMKFIWK